MNSEYQLAGSVFTKKDTQTAKGIAILCMLLHHTIPNRCELPLFLLEDVTVFSLIGATGKLCVSLLTILSGYGLAQLYQKSRKTVLSDIKFVASHMLQLLSTYWPINVAAAVMWFLLCRTGYHFSVFVGPRDVLLAVLGLRSYVGGWYLFTIIILYLLFPLCYRLTERFRLWFLALSGLPWVLYFAWLFDQTRSIEVDSMPFYLFSFCLGIYLSVKGLLRVERRPWKDSLGCFLFFLLSLALRILFSLPADVFLSLSVLMLLTRTNVFSVKACSVLEALGRESANIWLVQIPLLSMLNHFLPNTPALYFPKYALLTLLSFFLAKTISRAKKLSGYSSLVSRARKAIEV